MPDAEAQCRSPAELGLPGWIAHGGLARTDPDHHTTRSSLDRCLAAGADWIELDVCATADRVLLVRHDGALTTGEAVCDLDHRRLLLRLPGVLSLDEAVEHVAGRRPLLLDLKTDAAIGPLGRWLSARHDHESLAVCTDQLPALLRLQELAPSVARWPTLPDLGRNRPGWQGWLAEAAGRHRHPRQLGRLAAEVSRGVAELRRQPHRGRARLGGVPWRRQLPAELSGIAGKLGAGGFCFQHWLVTPELCEATRRLGLTAVAWTVNQAEHARRVAACGVDLVTSDDVTAMRDAVGGGPDQPGGSR